MFEAKINWSLYLPKKVHHQNNFQVPYHQEYSEFNPNLGGLFRGLF